MVRMSNKSITRLLRISPENLCVDGTQIHEKRKLLAPYKKQIYELMERGFNNEQIVRKLNDMFPGLSAKRSTVGDFCRAARAKIFDYAQDASSEDIWSLSENSILTVYADKINEMFTNNRPITVIFAAIKADGYCGSYSLLAGYCRKMKPVTYMTKKENHIIKRKELASAIWSGKSDLSEQALIYISEHYPVFDEIKIIVTEFRTAYSNKDVDAVKSWCEKYAKCDVPAICSFINGVNADSDAFYNSIKYEYSNGLLEGCVNKLKAVKRSMFGRASYALLRAKLLLNNNP